MKLPFTLFFCLVLSATAMAQGRQTDSVTFIHVVLQPAPIPTEVVITVPMCYARKTRFTGPGKTNGNRITGVVGDSLGQPVSYAVVQWVDCGNVVQADSTGRFSLPVNTTHSFELKITAVGYNTKLVPVADNEQPLNIILEETERILDPVVIEAQYKTRRCGIHCSSRCVCLVIRKQPVKRDSTSNNASPQAVVYPNPARPGTVIHLETATEIQTLQLVNNAGQVVFQQPFAVTKAESIQLQIPSTITPGIYYLVAVDRNNRKTAERVIIQ